MEHPRESLFWQVIDQPDIAPLIDHTLLKPDATYEDIRKVCEEAREYGEVELWNRAK